ncbi:citrate lyase, alpha subunit [Thermanaerovibrio velox DSM 12556]|uniref:Citrate lyase alpha chain n=1 Tax=Thermanaerovibrio velox DSM 12556 TaxID=926567 RepID=H0UPK8_9BACT|nr:citrate lyase subunit alpha [Thermanaerovibrio velox]EHM09555.1 citrate lyase, alpha subunit [Thermanaerovibrio velox DSM 12556]
MPVNALGRELPGFIEGYGEVKPFQGAFAREPEVRSAGQPMRKGRDAMGSKVRRSLRDAIEASGLKSGMTVSFHHHLRNGDLVVNQVIKTCAEMGIGDLTIFPTALFGVHKELIDHIRSGVVRRIMGSVNGPIGKLVSQGGMAEPVVLRSHGGRPRAVASGEVKIDVAFIGAPSADRFGNLSGAMGRSACGSLGYAFTDAMYADHVVAVTDNLVEGMLCPISIPQMYVDQVVAVESIGDPSGIVSGSTRITRDPLRLLIAQMASSLIEASSCFKDGISFQTGAGGIPLAVTAFMKDAMIRRNVKGSFGLGGITGYFVELLKEGLVECLMDVQSFDLEAVRSIGSDPRHMEISAEWYASPWTKGSAVDSLDVVILGATEVDLDFNVNVNTEADGYLLHGIGGHQDTAAGAKLTIIAQPLLRGRIPCVVDRVHCATTPGEVVDAVVTEFGITVNPARGDLISAAREAKLPLISMEELLSKARAICGPMDPLEQEDRIVAVVEWRDGTVIDVIRKVKA